MRYTTHAALVSEHPMPTLGPLLDPELGVQNAILIHGPERAGHAHHQGKVLERHGLHVRIEPVRDAYDLAGLRIDMGRILQSDQPIAVNITGGSKLMSIAAFEIALQRSHAPYYIHLHDDSIVWLEQDLPPHPIANRISVADYLVAIGLNITQPNHQAFSPAAYAIACRFIHPKHHEALRRITTYAHSAKADGQTRPIDKAHRLLIAGLSETLAKAGILGWDEQDPHRLRLHHPQARFYLDGGWLELYVEDILDRLKLRLPLLQDHARGIIIHQGQPNAPETLSNELDIALLYDNALHIIECKTGNMNGNWVTSDAEKMIYKLDMLRDTLGGIRGRALMLALKEPPKSVLKRAAAQGQAIFYGQTALARLEQHLEGWLRNKN